MAADHPETLDQYLDWAHNSDIPGHRSLEVEKNYYENLTRQLVAELKGSQFWTSLVASLRDADAEREISSEFGGLLAKPVDDLPILIKPWSSVLQKCHRKNVLNRVAYFPEEPDGGWVGPTNLLESMNDLLRTTVVTRYMDGIEDVRRILETVAADTSVELMQEREARDEGYYALHVVGSIELPVDTRLWEKERRMVRFEIQVCTQIQEVIRSLTHKIYEETRARPAQPRAEWQWDSSSPLFTPSYVGHLLHYADGVILNARRDRETGSAL